MAVTNQMWEQLMKNNKRGFNLIEIAIVLAVIGLVIGGIYVAASSVTDNQRKQRAQAQVLTIVQNMRTTFATQTFTSAILTGDVLEQARIIPADMPRVGTSANFSGAYGDVSINFVDAQTFDVAMTGVTRGGCVDLLTKSFGTSTGISQIGLVAAQAGSTTINLAGGIDLAEATSACASDNINVTFDFRIRL